MNDQIHSIIRSAKDRILDRWLEDTPRKFFPQRGPSDKWQRAEIEAFLRHITGRILCEPLDPANGEDPDFASSMEMANKIESLARGMKIIFHEFAEQCRHDESLNDQQRAALLEQLEKLLYFQLHEILRSYADDHPCPTTKSFEPAP